MTLDKRTVSLKLKPVRHKYIELGTHLGVSMNEFEVYKGDVGSCLDALIKLWYRKSPTKEKLMTALHTMGKLRLKTQLTDKYKGMICMREEHGSMIHKASYPGPS